MSKLKNKKSCFRLEMRSDPKRGMVGFLIKKGFCANVVKAEIFLLTISIFCISASYYILSNSFPVKF
jgi:hypothetical protein